MNEESARGVGRYGADTGTVLLVLVALVAGLGLRLLLPFAGTLLLAVVTAALLQPWQRWLTTRLGGRAWISASVLCTGLVILVLGPLFSTAVAVSKEAATFYQMTSSQLSEEKLRMHLEDRRESLESISAVTAPLGLDLTPEQLYPRLSSLGLKVGAFFYRQGVSLAKRLVNLALAFVLWVIILYFLLVDGEHLQRWFEDTLPLPPQQLRRLLERFLDMARSILIGNGIAGIIQGVCGGLLFAALDLPGPVLWGVVMGILAFLPIIGISTVYIPGFVILLMLGDTRRAFLMLVPLMALATVVEYVWKPRMVGRRMRMHTAMVLLSMIGGFQAFGPLGLLEGPMVMTGVLTLAAIYRESYRPRQPSGALPATAASAPPDPADRSQEAADPGLGLRQVEQVRGSEVEDRVSADDEGGGERGVEGR